MLRCENWEARIGGDDKIDVIDATLTKKPQKEQQAHGYYHRYNY